jgi:hypothetical protein
MAIQTECSSSRNGSGRASCHAGRGRRPPNWRPQRQSIPRFAKVVLLCPLCWLPSYSDAPEKPSVCPRPKGSIAGSRDARWRLDTIMRRLLCAGVADLRGRLRFCAAGCRKKPRAAAELNAKTPKRQGAKVYLPRPGVFALQRSSAASRLAAGSPASPSATDSPGRMSSARACSWPARTRPARRS